MNICIIGGGSAGWMTACYLIKSDPSLNITLIESHEIPIIGVGESTVPSFVDFINYVGLTEEDLFNNVGSIRKYTAQHNDWDYKGHSWWHHFIFDKNQEEEQLQWMNNKVKPDKKWRFSYHIDANKFAILLRDKVGLPAGINHVYDTIQSVEIDGDIKSVTGDKNIYTADLFIDCSGLSRLLIDKFDIKKESNPLLINNKAWVGQVSHQGNEINNYTKSFAMKYGWQWNIYLQDRVGVGYVFCDSFVTDDEAKDELIKNCHYDIKDINLRLINFKSEWNTIVWHKNVLAIGLSAGFLEPLEATGIFLVQMQIQMLSRVINKQNNIKLYNKFWNIMIKHISEYIEIHYTLSSRTDTEYWNSFNKIKEVEYNHTYSPLFHTYSYDAITSAYSARLLK